MFLEYTEEKLLFHQVNKYLLVDLLLFLIVCLDFRQFPITISRESCQGFFTLPTVQYRRNRGRAMGGTALQEANISIQVLTCVLYEIGSGIG